jgi:hypothetical protein
VKSGFQSSFDLPENLVMLAGTGKPDRSLFTEPVLPGVAVETGLIEPAKITMKSAYQDFIV